MVNTDIRYGSIPGRTLSNAPVNRENQEREIPTKAVSQARWCNVTDVFARLVAMRNTKRNSIRVNREMTAAVRVMDPLPLSMTRQSTAMRMTETPIIRTARILSRWRLLSVTASRKAEASALVGFGKHNSLISEKVIVFPLLAMALALEF
jgi:hypothetical protein